jgi:hypothetical protein
MSEEQDDLRARLTRIDPAAAGPVDPVTSPRASELLERTMQTLEPLPAVRDLTRPPRWRRPALVAAAAVAAVGIALSATQLSSDEDSPAITAPTTVALTAPAGGDGTTISSCLMFDVAVLRGMPVALAGTVVAQDADSVTLRVDRWYKGDSADQVRVATPEGSTSVALDGVAFEQGKRYLLTATDGTVNGCGFSGPATPELERSYAEAFGS